MLGLGQQFIAYGIHPETEQPYDWPVSSLADLTPDELPAVTEAQARAFAKAAYELIPHEARTKTLAVRTGAPSSANVSSLPDQRGTYAAVEEALRHIPNADVHYDSWVRIGMAIKGALGDEGGPLFEAWSASSQKNNPATTARSWRSFAPTRIGAGTLYKLALEQGWQPAPDLQLNGAIVMNGHHPARTFLETLDAPKPISERVVMARQSLGRALDAVGGLNSPGGCALWHVVGLGCSVKEWSVREGWNNRPINPHEAKGIVITALGVLALYYGYRR